MGAHDLDLTPKSRGLLGSPCNLTSSGNVTNLLSPGTPMDTDAIDASLLSFLEDPQWAGTAADQAQGGTAQACAPAETAPSTSTSAATMVDSELMEVCSPRASASAGEMSALTELPAQTVAHVKAEPIDASDEPAPTKPKPVHATPTPSTRTPRHRRSASAPSHLLSASVLGKRKPIKSPPPARAPRGGPKGRAAKLTRARHQEAPGGIVRMSRNSFEEDTTTDSNMSFALKQGKEGSRDEGKTNKHPTWIRSNMRATWGHLQLQCDCPEEAAALESLMRDGTPYGEYTDASLLFEMLYDNGDEVELLEKKGGNLADRVKIILPNGNVEQGLAMPDTCIRYHTAQPSSKQWVCSKYFQFDATRFPWNSDKKAKQALEDEETDTVEIGLKFATNVTTRAHNKRRFMWKVNLHLYDAMGNIAKHYQCCSPAFAYLPRNPEKSGHEFRLDDVVTEGHPGDLLMCGGSGLGCKQRPGLVAVLRGPKGTEVTLSRQSTTTKATFVSRLPSDLRPGSYTVQLVNEENPDEVTDEVRTKITAREGGECFELAEFTKQLEAEALSRQGSSEDEDLEVTEQDYHGSPGLRSQSCTDWPGDM